MICLFAYQRRNVDAILLVTTAHGEVLVNGLETVLGVTLGDGLRDQLLAEVARMMAGEMTHVEHLDVVEDVVVESEVVAGDDIDASILLDLPVGETQSLALGEDLVARDLAGPVGLVGLLQVTVHTHAGETEDGRLDHLGGSCSESGDTKSR